jgi:hypothetical protein
MLRNDVEMGVFKRQYLIRINCLRVVYGPRLEPGRV